ncbi:hypothetical protein DIPPA_11238 [Diplonema papillatum]|nr:hypothetical protein DIPPA_11238 [Diplonema papillatum]
MRLAPIPPGNCKAPEGVAEWVLAWLAVASAPSATADEFADLLRSFPKATPPPQTPGHMPLPDRFSR